MTELFLDRADAGRRLASRLQSYAGCPDTVVLALPRGGVPVAFEVASRLGLPLDVFVVRKLGVPGQRELAMGAVASGGVMVRNEEVVRALGISNAVVESARQRELREIEHLEAEYRRERAALDLRGKIVILIDDGLATGSTMLAAIQALKLRPAARIVMAVPVGARRTCERLAALVDESVCLETPDDFRAVGEWYLDFGQTTDEEVQDLLRRAAQPAAVEGPE